MVTRTWWVHCLQLAVSIVLSCSFQPVAAAHWWTVTDIFQLQHSLTHPHIVDSKYYNVLMRLGNPAVYSFFGGPQVSLIALANKLEKKAGNFFPKHGFDLVGVSLLSEPSEQKFNDIEQAAFDKRPFGKFIHWPTPGLRLSNFQSACTRRGLSCPDNMQPDEMPHEVRLRLAKEHDEWDENQFEKRVQALRALLEDTGSKPKVIFFHGIKGCDRTGALYAAYALRYRNRSLTEALAENELIARRHMSYKDQVAAQWYCESLVSRGLYTRGYDCGNCAPYRCWDSGDASEAWQIWEFNSGQLLILVVLLATIASLVRALRWIGSLIIPILLDCLSKLRGENEEGQSTFLGCFRGTCETPPLKITPATPPPINKAQVWRRRTHTDSDYMMLLSA